MAVVLIPRRLPSLLLSAGLAGGVVAWLIGAGPTAAVGLPVLSLLVGDGWKRLADRRARLSAGAEVIAAVDALLHRLEAGASLSAAAREVGLDLVDARAIGERGAPPEGGVDGALLAAVLTVLHERGGPAVPSLERLNDALRSARAVRQEAEAQAAQAVASATALALLPALGVAVLSGVDQRARSFYLNEPAGTACLLAAALLAYGGWLIVQRLVAAVTW